MQTVLKYTSRRHQKLMDASEYALHDAVEKAPRNDDRDRRVASTVLGDGRTYHSWELRHADLLLPAAQRSDSKRQLVELRNAEVQLVHRRALFSYLSTNEIRGELRRRLLRLHHRTLDFENAVLAEHRQYLLAESSRISADHIIGIMDDANGMRLVRQYERLYARYFELKCYIAMAADSSYIEMLRPILTDVHHQLVRVRHRIATEPPASSFGFDHQEALARSGRYEAINYLVG